MKKAEVIKRLNVARTKLREAKEIITHGMALNRKLHESRAALVERGEKVETAINEWAKTVPDEYSDALLTKLADLVP